MPLITVDGLHQLHILIFFLAVLHVAYSAITMALGRLKVRYVYCLLTLLFYSLCNSHNQNNMFYILMRFGATFSL